MKLSWWQGDEPTPPGVVVVERDERPLIGSTWHRREPVGDAFDTIVVRGIMDLPEARGGAEICVSPVDFGPTLTTTPEALAESYRREADDDAQVDELRSTIRELEARVRS